MSASWVMIMGLRSDIPYTIPHVYAYIDILQQGMLPALLIDVRSETVHWRISKGITQRWLSGP